MHIPCISLWQPWGSLWLTDAKLHETRHWPTHYRGPLLVQAAKRIERDVDERLEQICSREFGSHWRTELPLGAIVGLVNLVDCTPTDGHPAVVEMADEYVCGNFSPRRFAWKRGPDPIKFNTPVPYRGKQGFFHVEPEAVASQLPAGHLLGVSR